MARVAPKSILHAELDHAIGQDPFDAGALDHSRRESMPDNSRILAEDNLDTAGFNLAAIQHAVADQIARRIGAIIAFAEIVLSAAIQGEAGGQDVAVCIEKSNQ